MCYCVHLINSVTIFQWARPNDFAYLEPDTGKLWCYKCNFNYDFINLYHFRIKATINQFDSGAFIMSDTVNYLEFAHGLGTLPFNVRVMVTCQSGANNGFIFPASGSIMIDGSEIGSVSIGSPSGSFSYPETYGGLLFAYNAQTVRLWAPSGASGYIVNVSDV